MVADHFTDRDAFGHWFSGFTDGEGCFYLGCVKHRRANTPIAQFYINLRQDDRAILEEIRAFLGVGVIYGHVTNQSQRNAKPQSAFWVHRAKDVNLVLVPHFEKYPLRAKKARDFHIWKQGAELVYRVRCRPRRSLGRHGSAVRWTDAELAEFDTLASSLRQQRRFETTEMLSLPTKDKPSSIQLPLTLD
jgi:hypothetical protein